MTAPSLHILWIYSYRGPVGNPQPGQGVADKVIR